LFQSQIASSEPTEWLAGVLVSEILAKLILEEFVRLDLDPVLSDICHGILEDEARHLGFNQIYMEERFRELIAAGDEASATSESLHDRVQKVLHLVPPMFDAVDEELRNVGIDREHLFERVSRDSVRRLDRSIDRGHKLAEREAVVTA